MKVRLALCAAVLLLWTSACATPHDEQALPTWSIEQRPTLDIGDDEAGDVESTGDVVGVTRVVDGTVIVADRATSSIKFFSTSGALLRQVGRAGNGPGEFAQLRSMLRCGDSLFVFDAGIRQYKVLSLDGQFQRQFAFGGLAARQYAYRTECGPTGVMISYAYDLLSDLPPKSGVTRTLVPYWLSRSDGGLLTDLGKFGSSERWATVTDTVSGTGPLPLGKQPVIAVGRTRAYVGLADSFAVDVYGLDGKRLSTIHRASRVRSTTAADIERFKLFDTTGIPALHIPMKTREWSNIEFPSTLPPYSAILLDNNENLWIREYPTARDTVSNWIVFSPENAAIARVHLPLALDVAEIGEDYVLGTRTDVSSGVKRVQMFTLTRRIH